MNRRLRPILKAPLGGGLVNWNIKFVTIMRNRWLLSLMCGSLILGGSELTAQEFSILFTGSANGTYQNCHCPDVPLGGLDKRAQFIASYREQDPDVLVVDNGDNFVDYLSSGVERIINIAFDLTDFDMINIGDQDIAYGPPAYFDLSALIQAHGEAVAIRKGRVNFSVLPILHPGTTRFYPDFVFEDLDLGDYGGQITAWLEKNLPEGTFRVLLSHAGFEVDRTLAQKYPAIDLIIGGHSQTVLDTLVTVAGVPIVQAGGNGGYVGEIRFSLEAGDFRVLEHVLHPLTLEMPGHPEMIKRMDQYNRGD